MAHRRDRISDPILSPTMDPLRDVLRSVRPAIAQMEDLRRFRFDPLSKPASVYRSDSRVLVRGGVDSSGRETFSGLRFSVPDRVALCAKRNMRKEVLFALKFAGGRGRGKRKPYKRNYWSQVSC